MHQDLEVIVVTVYICGPKEPWEILCEIESRINFCGNLLPQLELRFYKPNKKSLI